MKSLALPSKILAILISLGAVGLLFLPFVSFNATGGVYGTETYVFAQDVLHTFNLRGVDMVFGLTQVVEGNSIELAISSFFTFAFIVTAFAAFLSVLSYKFKGSAIATVVFQLMALISMFVYLVLRPAHTFVDSRAFVGVNNISYTMYAWLFAGGLLLAIIIGTIAVLIRDNVEAKEKKAKTIPQRVGKFLKEFISEIKKIVWPSKATVWKNVIVVVVICAIVGGFIFGLDFGLAQLLTLIYG